MHVLTRDCPSAPAPADGENSGAVAVAHAGPEGTPSLRCEPALTEAIDAMRDPPHTTAEAALIARRWARIEATLWPPAESIRAAATVTAEYVLAASRTRRFRIAERSQVAREETVERSATKKEANSLEAGGEQASVTAPRATMRSRLKVTLYVSERYRRRGVYEGLQELARRDDRSLSEVVMQIAEQVLIQEGILGPRSARR